MIQLIKEHGFRREYMARTEDEAKSFANLFNGSYFKLMEDYYRILI